MSSLESGGDSEVVQLSLHQGANIQNLRIMYRTDAMMSSQNRAL